MPYRITSLRGDHPGGIDNMRFCSYSCMYDWIWRRVGLIDHLPTYRGGQTNTPLISAACISLAIRTSAGGEIYIQSTSLGVGRSCTECGTIIMRGNRILHNGPIGNVMLSDIGHTNETLMAIYLFCFENDRGNGCRLFRLGKKLYERLKKVHGAPDEYVGNIWPQELNARQKRVYRHLEIHYGGT